MYAPVHHPAMKAVAPVRREMGVRTLFNILGPLTNPAGAPGILMGGSTPTWSASRCGVAGTRRRARWWSGAATVWTNCRWAPAPLVGELRDGKVREYELHLEDFASRWRTAATCGSRMRSSRWRWWPGVDNQRRPAARDRGLLNAGAALYAPVARTSGDGIACARAAIASGRRRARPDEYVATTRALAGGLTLAAGAAHAGAMTAPIPAPQRRRAAPEALGHRHRWSAAVRVLWMGTEDPACPRRSAPRRSTSKAAAWCRVSSTAMCTSGGGGEAGHAFRVPAPLLSRYTTAGVTTVVGLFRHRRHHPRARPNCLASRQAARAGLGAWYCGGYHAPPAVLTGTVRGDLVFVEPLLGVGELAISDHRSSQPTLDELLRIAADAHVAGLMTGKAGIVHLHW